MAARAPKLLTATEWRKQDAERKRAASAKARTARVEKMKATALQRAVKQAERDATAAQTRAAKAEAHERREARKHERDRRAAATALLKAERVAREEAAERLRQEQEAETAKYVQLKGHIDRVSSGFLRRVTSLVQLDMLDYRKVSLTKMLGLIQQPEWRMLVEAETTEDAAKALAWYLSQFPTDSLGAPHKTDMFVRAYEALLVPVEESVAS